MTVSPRAGLMYRVTGAVGTPIHELAHAAMCLLFGLRITGMSLYRPHAKDGSLGYVAFSFNPGKIRHQIGCIVQGIAPLIAGGAIVALVLEPFSLDLRPEPHLLSILAWMKAVAAETVALLADLFASSPLGPLWALLLVIVCLHAIPSMADITISLGGVITLAVFGLIFVVAFQLLTGLELSDARNANIVLYPAMWLETALWWLLSASVAVVVLAVLGSLALLIMPNLLVRAVTLVFKLGSTGGA